MNARNFPRLLVFAVLLFLGGSQILATPPVRVTCQLCGEDFTTTRMDCPRCGLVLLRLARQLTDEEKAGLREFVRSETYTAALARSTWSCVGLLVERVPMTSRNKAFALHEAAGYAKEVGDERRLLEAALVALRAWESGPTVEAERSQGHFLLAEVLRRLSRFEEARVVLVSLESEKKNLQPSIAIGLQQEADRLEARDTAPHFWPVNGQVPNIYPVVRPTKEATFALPLNQTATILERPKGKYPFAMRYGLIIGEALVAVSVTPDGTVFDAKALSASQTEFIEEAVKFARGCRFAITAQESGRAFECTIAVVFELKDE